MIDDVDYDALDDVEDADDDEDGCGCCGCDVDGVDAHFGAAKAQFNMEIQLCWC